MPSAYPSDNPAYSTLEVVHDDPGKQVAYSPAPESHRESAYFKPTSPAVDPEKTAAAAAAAPGKRYCGLAPRMLLVVIVAAVLIIGGAIGGAVGGVLAHKSSSSSSKTAAASTSATASGTATASASPTSTGLTLHPESKLTSAFLTISSSITREFLFFQDTNADIHCAVYGSDNKIWEIYNVQDGTTTSSSSSSSSSSAAVAARPGTPMSAAVGAGGAVHLFYLSAASGTLTQVSSTGGRLWTLGALGALAEVPVGDRFAATRIAAAGLAAGDSGPALAYVVSGSGSDNGNMRVAVQDASKTWNTSTGFEVATSYNSDAIAADWFPANVVSSGVAVYTQNADNITLHQFNVSSGSFVRGFVFPYTPTIGEMTTYNFLPSSSNAQYTNIQNYILLANGTLTTLWETGGVLSTSFALKTNDPVDLNGAGMSNSTWTAMTTNDNFNFYGVAEGQIVQWTIDPARQTWKWVTVIDINW